MTSTKPCGQCHHQCHYLFYYQLRLSLGNCGRRFLARFLSKRRFYREIVTYEEVFSEVTFLASLSNHDVDSAAT